MDADHDLEVALVLQVDLLVNLQKAELVFLLKGIQQPYQDC